jgi:amylosucrase
MPLTDPDRRAGFDDRLERHREALGLDLALLYGDRAQSALDRLLSVIEEAALARPARLAALDQAREADPSWYLSQTQLGYCCYADRFGFTLAGIAARIPYLREIGVTYLHLLPFWRRPPGPSDGGFAVSDHEAVDPHLGQDQDLDALAATLLDAGITLCADFVLNHTADDHRWAMAAKSGDPQYRDYYRIFETRDLPDQFEATLVQVFPETAPGNFTEVPAAGGWVWTTFYPFQWDLNWSNPDVLVEMVRILLALANRGIGAFRLDSAPFLWKRLGTDCQNQPETHTILRVIRAAVSVAAPAVLLKAEAVVPSRDLPAYFGLPTLPGSECHLAYQTSIMAGAWAAVAHQDAALLRQVLADLPPLGQAGTWLTYIRCHDDIGWRVLAPEAHALGDPGQRLIDTAARFFTTRGTGTYPRGLAFQSNGLVATNGMAASLTGIEAGCEAGDESLIQAGIDRLILLYALAFAVGGLPVIYMGDELGQMNAPMPDGEIDGRWIHRPFFDEEKAAERHDAATIPCRIFRRLTRLAEIRRATDSLRGEAPLRLLPADYTAVCAFARGTDFLAAFNFSDRPAGLAPTLAAFAGPGVLRDLIGGGELGSDTVLDPWGFVWAELVP